jgi:hypothetical protein
MASDAHGDRKQAQQNMSGRGARPAIDWEAAFVYYGSLSPAERSYIAVAAEFGVSVRTVENHGRKEKWKERVVAITRDTRVRTAESLVEARVAEVEEMRRLMNASLVAYAEALRNGMRMSTADLERLNRLSLAFTEEALSPQLLGRDHSAERPVRTAEHAQAVLDALAEAGALEALGLTRVPAGQNDASPERKVEDDR